MNSPLVGVIGGGQLGRMLALAGYSLGLNFRFIDPDPNCPASKLGECVVGEYDDPTALERFADRLDVVTYEFENIPVSTLDFLDGRVKVYPNRNALAVSQDRLFEKQFFAKLGINTAQFASVDTLPDLENAIEAIGLPVVLKTRRFGYDGKGQQVIRKSSEIGDSWAALQGQALIVEEMIDFDEEISLIAARCQNGEISHYPISHNTHSEGILRRSWADASNVSRDVLTEQGREIANRILEELDYVGILAVELFVKDEELIANEMAPRVHNSGHWTINGSNCSQFENHLRAILDFPLGSGYGRGFAGMINIIGEYRPITPILAQNDVFLHLYGKVSRPGRKLGHVNVVADRKEMLMERLDQLS